MDVKTLRAAKNEQPFKPFVVTFVDGRRFDIPHSDFLSINPNGRSAVVYKADGSYSVVEPLLIQSIDYNVPTTTNGSSPPSA
jgi:hypothetical protein